MFNILNLCVSASAGIMLDVFNESAYIPHRVWEDLQNSENEQQISALLHELLYPALILRKYHDQLPKQEVNVIGVFYGEFADASTTLAWILKQYEHQSIVLCGSEMRTMYQTSIPYNNLP